MDELLCQFAKRCRLPESSIVTADEASNWPNGVLEELLSKTILKEVEPARTVICDQCPDNCTIQPDRRDDPATGKTIGVFVCYQEPEIGRMEIDLQRLRRWKIDAEKLKELGYIREKLGRKQSVQDSPNKSRSKDGELAILLGMLMVHHKSDSDQPNWEPATQKELAGKLGWNQSKVSRVMARLFDSEPMKKYKQSCATKAISGFLKRHDDGTTDVEAVSG